MMPATETGGTRTSADAIRSRVASDALGVYASILGCSADDFVKKGINEQVVRCALHNDEHPSLRVNTSKGVWRCDPCGKGGDTFDLYAALQGLDARSDFPRVVEGLAATLGISGAMPPIVLNGGARHAAGRARTVLTLAQFASAKGLPEKFLAQHGVTEEKSGLKFTYFTRDGQKAARHKLRLSQNGEGGNKFIWIGTSGASPLPYLLQLLDDALKNGASDLVLCEGESDALTFLIHGIPAIGIPGADMTKVLTEHHIRGFNTIIIAKEPDQGGPTFVKGICGRLAELRFRGVVKVVDYSKAAVKDSSELHTKYLADAGGFESEWAGLCQMTETITIPVLGMVRRAASEIESRPVEFMWPGRVPLSAPSLIVGDPGEAKSTICCDFAARVSRGAAWPDGRRPFGPCSVMILSGEDDPSTTIRPRLEAAGADLDRVQIIEMVRAANREGDVVERGFNLVTDLPLLDQGFKECPDTRLCIIDPISSYLGATDSHKNSDVRAILAPMAKLAEKYRCAFVLVSHLNKGSGAPQHRVTGSIAFIAAARAAYLCMTDPDDDEVHLFMPLKMNLAAKGTGLKYRILADDHGRSFIDWGGETTKTADEAMAEVEAGRKPSQRAEAAKFLDEMLRGSARWMVEVEREASKRAITQRTLRRAREELKIEVFREGGGVGGRWMWKLPE